MTTTNLMLKTDFEGRVLRTLQAYFRRPNDVLIRESLKANGMNDEDVALAMDMLNKQHTVSEIMETLRQKGTFANRK